MGPGPRPLLKKPLAALPLAAPASSTLFPNSPWTVTTPAASFSGQLSPTCLKPSDCSVASLRGARASLQRAWSHFHSHTLSITVLSYLVSCLCLRLCLCLWFSSSLWLLLLPLFSEKQAVSGSRESSSSSSSISSQSVGSKVFRFASRQAPR